MCVLIFLLNAVGCSVITCAGLGIARLLPQNAKAFDMPPCLITYESFRVPGGRLNVGSTARVKPELVGRAL